MSSSSAGSTLLINPSPLIIPYTSPHTTFSRKFSITNTSTAPIRLFVKLADGADAVSSERVGDTAANNSSRTLPQSLHGSRNATTTTTPFTLSYQPQQLFSNQTMNISVTYKASGDMSLMQQTMIRIMSANEVRLVQVRAMPVVTMRPVLSSGAKRRPSSSHLSVSATPSSASIRRSSLRKTKASGSTRLSFLNTPLNETRTKALSLMKLAMKQAPEGLPLGAEWRVRFREPRERGVWKVSPKEGIFESSKPQKINIGFSPVQERTSHQDLLVEFQYVDVGSGQSLKEVVPVSLVGTGIEESDMTKTPLLNSDAQNVAASLPQRTSISSRASLSNSKALEAAGIASAHSLHQKLVNEQMLSNYTLQSTTNQIKIHERLQKDLQEASSTKTMRGTKRRLQSTSQQMAGGMKSPRQASSATLLLDRKQKEADLMRKASQFHEHEKMKEIKWFKEVGTQPPSKEEQEAIKTERQQQRELQALRERELNRERKTNDTSIGKPVVQQDIKQSFIEESADRVKRQQMAAQALPKKEVIEEEIPAPEEKAKKVGKKVPKKGAAKANAEEPPPKERVPTPTAVTTAIPPEQLEQEQLNQQLTEEFVRFSNVVLLRERVRRRLNFIALRTEEQNIQLALKEANIPRVDTQLMKIRRLPVPPVADAGADAPLPEGLDAVTMPQFKDFSFVNLKVPLDYKIKGYEMEKMLPLNTYMPPEDVIDYQKAFNVPFPVEHEFDLNAPVPAQEKGAKGKGSVAETNAPARSEEQMHKALLCLIEQCNDVFVNQPVENANYVDPAHFGSLVAYAQRVPSEGDPTYEILSQNKRTLIEAYDRAQEKQRRTVEDGQTMTKPRGQQDEQVVFTTFSSQFEVQEVNISDPMPLHAAVKKRNVPLKEYARNDGLSLPALRPFTISLDGMSEDEFSNEEDTARTKPPPTETTDDATNEKPPRNFASVLANYSLLHLYPELEQHIEGATTEEPVKDAGKKGGKAATSKSAAAEEPRVPVKVNVSDQEMARIMLENLTP
eukprot:CAMPEP_0117447210 /NCGR_PEP_ID=MMETSP0759-20121206/6753_1 /TAXON_ID=63605 /ORGANISM="Percolomonas cosmopolitus, Strain WS" /LENGTH=1013 /DNA_ID=CAMNT_0005239529 /DNA_START=143 /DNA_END=3181 /DNA_ORIENTATION=+